MRHITGPGHRAHIGDGLDAVLLQQAQEIVERRVRVADREQARVRRQVPGWAQATGRGGVRDRLLPSAAGTGDSGREPGQAAAASLGQRREVVFHRGGPGVVQGDGHGASVLPVDDPRVADGPAGFPGADHPGCALRAVDRLEHRARFACRRSAGAGNIGSQPSAHSFSPRGVNRNSAGS